MKATMTNICATLAVGTALALTPATLAATAPSRGVTPTAYAALASKANAAGHTQTALFFLEQALSGSVGQPAVFGPLAGRYWQRINQAHAWSRAYDFFAGLEAAHSDDPNVLANYANAIGGLLGTLAPDYGKQLPPAFFRALSGSAMRAYSRALSIQSDNFTALLGRAIFLSHTPNGMAQAESGFKHILALRQSHPHYPYALVYRQWAAALRRNGQPERAKKVLRQGKAALGAAAFSQRPHSSD